MLTRPAVAGSDPADRLFPSILSLRPVIVVAVSGGSDSTALLVMACEAARRGTTRIVAATVDHGLRAQSAAEAAAVASLCARLGVEHHTLPWPGGKPASGISQAAREARHRLLAGLAEAVGTDIVLTGHTLDDQAETVAMRAARGDGLGLAGMAPATLFDGRVWFLRPLLDRRRSDLRALLSARNVVWIDDPSNVDPRFERARLRAATESSPGPIALSRGEAVRRRQAMERAGRQIGRHATMPAPGLARLDAALLAGDRETALLVIRLVLAGIGGTEHLPPNGAVQQLMGGLSQPGNPVSLGRCLVERRGDAIFVWREARGFRPTDVTGRPVLWDGRWKVVAQDGSGLTVDIAGPGPEISEEGLPRRPLRGAALAEPMLWREGSLLGPLRSQAASHGVSATPVVAPYARFLPAFDLAAAAALARLVGTPQPPHLPWEWTN